MKFLNRLGLIGAIVLTPTLAVPVAAAVSKAVGNALNQAASASKAGNTGAASNAINAAKAAAKTPEERAKVSQMAAYVFTRAGQYGKAAAELEAGGTASPKQLASLYYNAGNYTKAVELARKAGGDDMQVLIAQAAIKQGHYSEAVTAYNKLITMNGAKPLYLENLAGAQYKAGDKKAYLATTEKLIRVDSSPARWKTLLVEQQKNQMRPEAKLALFHLMEATGNIDRPADIQEFAKLAIVNYQPGVAKEILSKAGGSLGSDPMTAKLAQAAATRAQAAVLNAPKLAANPATAAQAGGAYLGLGQYPAAVSAYAKAAAAGGPDADQAKIFEGISQVKAGSAAAAKTTFASVSDANGMKDIADLWRLYASTKG
ncbi:MAG: tetratricopeptide repeat protein [Janthinobacterium lividum]